MARQSARSFEEGIRHRLMEARDRIIGSQQKMADRLGIEKDRYSKWENRSVIPIEFIPQVCEILGISAWYLLTGELKEEHMLRRTEEVAARPRPIPPHSRSQRQTPKSPRTARHG